MEKGVTNYQEQLHTKYALVSDSIEGKQAMIYKYNFQVSSRIFCLGCVRHVHDA